jgi:hypothetical protein
LYRENRGFQWAGAIFCRKQNQPNSSPTAEKLGSGRLEGRQDQSRPASSHPRLARKIPGVGVRIALMVDNHITKGGVCASFEGEAPRIGQLIMA